MAGGSSGSITTFTYESMLKNPVMHRCGTKRCSADADAARVALALKSVQGYANVVGDSEEAVSIKGLAATAAKLQADYAAKGIGALGTAESVEAAKRLKEVLSVPEVRAIVNPEVFTMLADVPHLAFNVNEIKTSITQLGAFSVDDNRLFFRSGVLNWPALASALRARRRLLRGLRPERQGGHERMARRVRREHARQALVRGRGGPDGRAAERAARPSRRS